ncbi:MAG: OmpA family protein [Candidatus Tectomicrobia bacterium]|nr:OmpA family protein [Candidatus Tectomicrobia bacterium]
MRGYALIMAIAMAGFGMMFARPYPVSAQTPTMYTDFRGRAYSMQEFEQALFPKRKSNLRTRGIPQLPPSPPPPDVTASVVLNVFFAFDSEQILPQYYPDLDILGEVLVAPPHAAVRIQIEGHTDSVGQERYNQALSLRRAASIVQYLTRNFPIEPQRLSVSGYGESQPIADNATPVGRRVNRRVEVMNTGQ